MIGAAWPAMYGELGVSDSRLGIVSTILTCCCIVANIYSPRLLNRFSTGSLIAASMLIIGLSTLGFGLSGTFASLCIFAVLLGLALGCIDAVMNNFMAVNYKSRHMNWLHGCWGLGATISPIILAAGMERFGTWRAGYFSVSGIHFVITIVLFLSLPLWKKVSKPTEQVEEYVKTDYKEVMRLKGIKLSLIAFFFYCALEISLGLWGSTYLVMIKKVTEEQAAGWLSLLFLGLTLGRLITGFLTFKLSNTQLIRIGGALVFVGILILFLSSRDAAYMIGFFIFGFGCGPIWPCLIHETPKRFGEAYSQLVVGLQLVASNAGNALAPLVFGAMAAYTGYATLPLYLVVLLIVTMIAIEIQNRRQTL